MPWSFYFSVWFQTDICLTNGYLFETNIPNNTLYLSQLSIVLHPTHDIRLHVCSAPWDTKPGLLCRFDSTTHPRYAVLFEPWLGPQTLKNFNRQRLLIKKIYLCKLSAIIKKVFFLCRKLQLCQNIPPRTSSMGWAPLTYLIFSVHDSKLNLFNQVN